MSDLAALARYVDALWEDSVIPALSSYVQIRCLSPEFDTAWAENGEIARAAELLSRWAASRPIPGCTVELLEREGITPAILADVPASQGARTEPVTLLYGHLDKQPPLGSWREGLDPFVAVREDDRLYGRGTADDGYSIFAAIGAIEALAATDTPHGRCIVLIEASEESGSPHLGPYLQAVSERIGPAGPGLVVCLDSGCATYDRLWTTTSLRGNLIATVSVEVLTVGVHSGLAGGTVPSSFRLLRRLLSRLEDEATGEIIVPECRAPLPDCPDTGAVRRHRRGSTAASHVVGVPRCDGDRRDTGGSRRR
jgi:acetylornithine deacetylase/succinyl-diaminopimelate desuccinylase-like protein